MATEQELLAEIERLNNEVSQIHDQVGDGEPTKTQYETVTGNNKRIAEIEAQVKDIRDQREQWQQARIDADRRKAEARVPVNGLGAGKTRGGEETKDRQARSAGESVLEDADFKQWLERITYGGGISSARFGSSPRVTFAKGLKALVANTDVTGSQFYGLPAGGFVGRALTVRDLVTTGTTNSNAIDYVIEGTWTNAAAPITNATESSGATGAKPESSLAFTQASTTVKTIAHWVAIARSVLADAGQLRMYIDQFLRYGLEEELEDQMLTGDGTGNNFTGIMNTTGTQTQAFDTDVLTTLRRARTKVRVGGRATPTAYVMHPNDWEDIDLLQDNEGRYYYGGPSVIGQPRLWGLPVVESEGMTEGFSAVGDWRRAVLLDREQVQVFTSDSHSDFFVRNLIALLAELRAAFFVTRPAAFVEADLTS